MALDRFTNKDEILTTNGVVSGIVWNEEDQKLLQLDMTDVAPTDTPIVELHAYTPSEDYITGGLTTEFEIQGSKLYVNYTTALKSFELTRGLFEVVVNIHRPLLSQPEEPSLYIKEISPDRREVYIAANLPEGVTAEDYASTITEYLDKFGRDSYSEIITDEDGNEIGIEERPMSNEVALNLGQNRIFKIINQKSWGESNEIVVRLYKKLPATINEKMPLWIVEELADSFIDNVDINVVPTKAPTNIMAGANFTAGDDYSTITETDFKSWNELLGSSAATSQQIIDKIFSGSFGSGPSYEGPNNYSSAPAIDYSGFQNFIHYSSAKERVINFKYKLQLIEYHEREIGNLNNALGDDATTFQGTIDKNENFKNQIVGGFDGFERWLYYEQTSSLFTHFENVYNRPGVNVRSNGGFIGAEGYTIQPYPKYISSSAYEYHHSTSSLASSWYEGVFATASLYDDENNDQLRNTIPAHIQEDENNSQYVMFIDMMAHHFDILYSYIKALTKVPVGEEHPKLGVNKHLLYDAAKGMGWTLANGRQASALWQYTLGKSGSGQFKSTGQLFSKPDEDITTEVWRRIVNNLPYLLKSKGTSRGIKALMNAYGVPQTLLSIREYGGPKISGDAPALIEDRFSYALQMNPGARLDVPYSYAKDVAGVYGAVNTEYPIQTHEIRFKPGMKQDMLLLTNAYVPAAGGLESPNWHVAIQHTASYSGSTNYGRVHFSMATDAFGGASASMTQYIPIYDGNFWNLSLGYTTTGTHFNKVANTDTTYNLKVQQASDYITGKIVHTSNLALTPSTGSHFVRWGNQLDTRRILIGGSTGSSGTLQNGVKAALTASFGSLAANYPISVTNTSGMDSSSLFPSIYSGSVQEYRQWIEEVTDESFNYHTLNPSSYVSSRHPTASYDTLVRHYPLGTDLNAVDRSVGTGLFLSSSHPNQTITDFSSPYTDGWNTKASASGFVTPLNAQRGNYEPVEETYYIQGISLGGNNPRSQKIRLESNELIRPLSVTSTSEKSSFDYAPVDSNRLGLFYSMADQINKDIFNHVGDVELDDYVGDPSHEFETSYPDLHRFADNYWKKYNRQNDINAYIRIFSLYDFTLFKQIKQLLPARADVATGLLIEPHALERAKVKIYDQPVKTEPMFTASVQYMDIYANTNPTGNELLTGTIVPISGSIDMPHKHVSAGVTNMISQSGYWANEYTAYFPGSGSKDENGNSNGSILVADNNVYNGTVYKHIGINFPYQVDPAAAIAASMPNEVTTSQHPLNYSPTGSVIWNQRNSLNGDMYQINHYHSTSLDMSKRDNTLMRTLSQSLNIYWSQSLIPAPNRFIPIDLQNQRFSGCKLQSAGINQASNIPALSYKPIIEVYEVSANQLIYTQNKSLGNLDVQ